jgi:hypothetical protein
MTVEQHTRPPRSRRRSWTVAGAVVVVVLLGIAAYLFQPWRLWTDVVVDEAVPTSAVAGAAAAPPSAAPPPSASASPSAAASQAAPAVPRRLLQGSFVSQAHETRGTAVILQLADGSRVLRLEGLATDDGPDLKVWLTDAPATRDGGDAVDAGRYVDLGGLKGNVGNQNYPIPADVDLEGLRSVSIWCDRFDVSFGVAALAQA